MTQALSSSDQVSYEIVERKADEYQIPRPTIRNILGISESTQFRYEKNKPVLKPNLLDRWSRFERILQQARDLFESKAETQRWLSTPKSLLENKTPLEVLATDAGAKTVEQMLNRAKYGIFS